MGQRMRKNYSCVVDLLGCGEDAACSAEKLAVATSTDKRTVRRLVSEARKDGVLVCSGDSGYWLPGCREELRRSYLRMKAQARNIDLALETTKKALKDCEGQIEIDLEDEGEDVEGGDEPFKRN